MPTNFISLADAIALTTTYRGAKEVILEPQYKNRGILPVCETFPRAAFDTVLAKHGCVGLRFYFSMDQATNSVKLIVVGVNDQDQDMIPDLSSGRVDATLVGDDIIDQGKRCPFDCPPPSALNS
jgi:hypothetical protein